MVSFFSPQACVRHNEIKAITSYGLERTPPWHEGPTQPLEAAPELTNDGLKLLRDVTVHTLSSCASRAILYPNGRLCLQLWGASDTSLQLIL